MHPFENPIVAVLKAKRVLSFTNRELAKHLGVATRTVQRWISSTSRPSTFDLQRLAQSVWPTDPELAGQLAAYAGTTLEALGLVAVPTPAEPPAAPPKPAPPAQARQEQADSVVLAAAAAADLSPRVVGPAVAAAFRRALALGVDLKGLVKLLEPAAQPAEPKR